MSRHISYYISQVILPPDNTSKLILRCSVSASSIPRLQCSPTVVTHATGHDTSHCSRCNCWFVVVLIAAILLRCTSRQDLRLCSFLHCTLLSVPLLVFRRPHRGRSIVLQNTSRSETLILVSLNVFLTEYITVGILAVDHCVIFELGHSFPMLHTALTAFETHINKR